jgi:ABC-type transport system involved in cytochrome bd biosynthesis fused ATPase/permease subunit
MSPFYSNNLGLVLLITLWTIPWKIYAVWLAAKKNDKRWFVALLLLNTVGILEIFYIFKIVGKKWTEVKEDFKKALASF